MSLISLGWAFLYVSPHNSPCWTCVSQKNTESVEITVKFCNDLHFVMFIETFSQELLAANQESPIDKNQGPPLDANQQENYKKIQQILLRLTNLCYQDKGSNVNKKKHEQRLLRWVHLFMSNVFLDGIYANCGLCEENALYFILWERIDLLFAEAYHEYTFCSTHSILLWRVTFQKYGCPSCRTGSSSDTIREKRWYSNDGTDETRSQLPSTFLSRKPLQSGVAA